MIKLYDKNMNESTIDIDHYIIDIFPLDNFSPYGLVMNGEYFQTAEHAFQYLKFEETDKNIANKIMRATSPYDAREIAAKNKSKRIPNWKEVKYDYMKQVFRLKLEQNPKVKDALLNTEGYLIIEKCLDEDTDWGLDRNNQGENNLGKIWMKIREEINK